jgi:hypothetical protein
MTTTDGTYSDDWAVNGRKCSIEKAWVAKLQNIPKAVPH